MRWLRHLIAVLVAVVIAVIGGLAAAFYDPLSHAHRWLKLSQMVVAPAGTLRAPGVSEPTVEVTDSPEQAALARLYQPTLVLSAYDRFWPIGLSELLSTTWHGQPVCLFRHGRCTVRRPRDSDLHRGGSADWLQFPTPVNNVGATFYASARALHVPGREVSGWRRHPAAVDPFGSAQMYFYELPRTTARSYAGAPAGLIALEYWFFYPLNYFPLVRIPTEALNHPTSSTIGNTDYHQGDLEHVAVLIDPATMRPRYLWMARHANEGELYAWGSRSVQWLDGHPVVYAALGSHASYAQCGIERRRITYLLLNDYVVCIPHETYAFLPATTPLVDLASVPWACFAGHLGEAGRRIVRSTFHFVPYEASGPVSPLYQQENFRHSICVPHRGQKAPAPQL